MTPIKFHFINPVWGEKYARQFAYVNLPCQLSEGNLGHFRGSTAGDKYNIYTTWKDAKIIKEAPAFAKLKEIMDTEFHFIDDAIEELDRNKEIKYDLLTICHSYGIKEALNEQAAFVSLCSDLLFSDGSFATLHRLATEGKRLVVVGSYRVITETFEPIMKERYFDAKEHTITMPAREFVKLSLDHIHPHTQTAFVNRPAFSDIWPAHIFWEVPGEGLLQRGFHLHPIMIYPTSSNATLEADKGVGIDGCDYMAQAVPDYDDVYVVDDSDDFTMQSLQPGGLYTAPCFDPINTMQLSAWAIKYCAPYHIKFMDTKIRFHAGEISSEWEQVEAKSDQVINNIARGIAFFQQNTALQEELNRHREATNDRTCGNMADLAFFRKELAEISAKLGLEYKDQGKLKEAARSFQLAIKANPHEPILYNHLGIALYGMKELKLAEDIFNSALRVAPRNIDAYVNLAELCVANERHEEALRYLKQAAEIAPDDVGVLTSLGVLSTQLGDNEAMAFVLQRFLAVQPGNPIVENIRQALDDTTMTLASSNSNSLTSAS